MFQISICNIDNIKLFFSDMQPFKNLLLGQDNLITQKHKPKWFIETMSLFVIC